jgi:hypothetical protein
MKIQTWWKWRWSAVKVFLGVGDRTEAVHEMWDLIPRRRPLRGADGLLAEFRHGDIINEGDMNELLHRIQALEKK